MLGKNLLLASIIIIVIITIVIIIITIIIIIIIIIINPVLVQWIYSRFRANQLPFSENEKEMLRRP